MKLLHLKGEYFRNISKLDIECSPSLNIIYGNNGSGKSTLLEMVYCLSRGRSFRTHLASPIIQHHKSHCMLFGKISADNHITSIGFQKTLHGKTKNRD